MNSSLSFSSAWLLSNRCLVLLVLFLDCLSFQPSSLSPTYPPPFFSHHLLYPSTTLLSSHLGGLFFPVLLLLVVFSRFQFGPFSAHLTSLCFGFSHLPSYQLPSKPQIYFVYLPSHFFGRLRKEDRIDDASVRSREAASPRRSAGSEFRRISRLGVC